jgi:hypothetical protein
MDGFEFLDELALVQHFTDKGCCIIMVSSSLNKADHDRAEANPIVKRFINKPLQRENLEEIKELYLRARTA